MNGAIRSQFLPLVVLQIVLYFYYYFFLIQANKNRKVSFLNALVGVALLPVRKIASQGGAWVIKIEPTE